MNLYKCPHCGWLYNPADYVGQPGVKHSPWELVPPHGADGCLGEEQHPRNAETDRRPLWKDE